MALLTKFVGVGNEVTVQTSSVDKVRLKIGTDTGVTANVVYTTTAVPDSDGWATLTLPSLVDTTRYYFRVAMTTGTAAEVLDTDTDVGEIPPLGGVNFAFCFASCSDVTNPTTYATIAARNDPLYLMTGDLYYADGTGTDLANYQAKMGGQLRAANFKALSGKTRVAYIPSDHDFGMANNAVGGNDTTRRTNYGTAYRQMVPGPHPGTSAAGGVYRTFVKSGIRFVMLDCRSFCSPIGTADSSSKTKLGATQKAWLKDTITAATEAVIVLVGDVPWTGPVSTNDDEWAAYNTERQEIANFCTASGKNFAYIGGDAHMVAADDGSHSPGGFPVFQAAPLSNNASIKGDPYSEGTYPTAAGTTLIHQYGRIVVTNTGSAVTFAFTGYDSANTVRKSYTHTFTTAATTYDVVVTPITSSVDNAAHTATLNWSLSGADSAKVTGFYVGRSASGTDPAWESSLLASSARTQTFTSLATTGTYTLYVDAVINGSRVKHGETAVTMSPTSTVSVTPVTATVDDAANSATLNWSLSGADSGTVTGFTVSRTAAPGGAPWTSALLSAATRTLTFTKLADGATYTLSVDAVASGSTVAHGEASVTLQTGSSTWTTVYEGALTDFTDTNLSEATSYDYQVMAVNADGTSDPSPVVTGTTTAVVVDPPGTPGAITAAGTDQDSTDLSWAAVTGATTYTLQRSLSATGTFTTVYGPQSLRSYTDLNLSPSTTYYYRLQASNSAGSSGWSATKSVTTTAVITDPNADKQPLSALWAKQRTGINGHANFPGTYTNMSGTERMVDLIGYGVIRTPLGSGADQYLAIAKRLGMKVVWSIDIASMPASDATIQQRVQWVADNAPNHTLCIEGPNEVNLQGSFPDRPSHIQQVMYKKARSLPALDNVPIATASLQQPTWLDAQSRGINQFAQLAVGSEAYCDWHNFHGYEYRQPPEYKLDTKIAYMQAGYGSNKQVYIGETGWSDAWSSDYAATWGASWGGRFVLEALLRKYPFTQYELLDDQPGAGVQSSYGVVDTNWIIDDTNWKLKTTGQSHKAVLDKWQDPVGTAPYTPNKVKCDVSTSGTVFTVLTATKAQSNAGTATVFVWRRGAAVQTAISVTITDRVGARTFSVGGSALIVDLR